MTIKKTVNPGNVRDRVTAFVKGQGVLHARTGVAAVLAGVVALGVVWGPDANSVRSTSLTVKDMESGKLSKPEGVILVAGSAKGLYSNFREIGYRLEDVRSGAFAVPRVYVKSIPNDIRGLESVETRKQVFIKTMLPLILRVNEELRSTRTRIQDIAGRQGEGGVLNARDREWLDAQYARYGVEKGDFKVLLRRVDVIPPSLALAQAAEESGWGTSRFALEARALFGQRAHPEGDGIIPTAYSEGDGIKVKSFNALLDGVRSYARNLNTHKAYTRFREKRADMRLTARSPVGLNSLGLAEALTSYSERGQAYVDTIRTIIRANNLRQLDGARLSNTVPNLDRSGA